MTLPAYTLLRSARRTLAIQIRQDGLVLVRAPQRLPLRDIERFVAERADWIRAHLDEIADRPPRPTLAEQLVQAGHWWHLGERWHLQPGRTGRSPVLMSRPGLLLHAESLRDDPERLLLALRRWQQREAVPWLTRRLQTLSEPLGAGWQPAGLAFRHMRSRWGSCSRDRRITLNTALMHCPVECIDYVIRHELCHLHEFNHGPRFHDLQTQLDPDWPEHKTRLDAFAREWLPRG